MQYRLYTTLIMATICCSSVLAEKIEHNGLYYNLNGTNAEVTYKGEEEDGWMYYSADELYTGTIIIPDTIVYNGTKFQVNKIGADAFAGSKLMENLKIPSSVTSIGSGAFSLCNSLENITVDTTNTTYFSYKGILYEKSPVQLYFVPRNIQGDIELDEHITTIPSSAFQNCTNITSVTLPDNVVTIADGAFNNCNSLEEIFLNEGLTNIGEYAFSKCSSLSVVNFPSSLKSIKSCAFSDCTNLSYALIHEGLETIGKMAFYECQNLVGIQLPSTLTSIGEEAFLDCFSLDVVQNNSALNVQVGEITNGYVAYYASQVTKSQTNTDLINNGSDYQTYQIGSNLTVANAKGHRLYIYNYKGQLKQTRKIMEDIETIDVGQQKVIAIIK